ncbi:MAG: hypothetical protein SGPRY_011439, partial [Prymnesium sp.]
MVGQRVKCNVGDWVAGTVIKSHYREEQWPEGKVVPYQVLLDDGRRVYAPSDSDRLIRAVGPLLSSPADRFPRAAPAEEARAAAERHLEDSVTAAEYKARCLHPDLFLQPQDDWFAPRFLEAFKDGGSPASLLALVHQEAPGIYSFDMLSTSFCDRLLEEMENFEASDLPIVRPNSMNNYGVVVNSIGMERCIDRLQRDYVRPLVDLLFPEEGEHVDHHHTFMVQYKQA